MRKETAREFLARRRRERDDRPNPPFIAGQVFGLRIDETKTPDPAEGSSVFV